MNDSPTSGSISQLQVELASAMEEIGKTFMPFGKFGPLQHPPRGVPIYDLPVEYLLWFKHKGFPKGKLGKLLELVCQIKVDGAEIVFEPFRKAAGGRHALKKSRQKEWNFDD